MRQYFLAMMWYGQNYFLAGQDGELLQSLLLTEQLHMIKADGVPLIDLWEKLYEPTAFYVGVCDELGPRDYKAAMDQVFGPTPSQADLLNQASNARPADFESPLRQEGPDQAADGRACARAAVQIDGSALHPRFGRSCSG